MTISGIALNDTFCHLFRRDISRELMEGHWMGIRSCTSRKVMAVLVRYDWGSIYHEWLTHHYHDIWLFLVIELIAYRINYYWGTSKDGHSATWVHKISSHILKTFNATTMSSDAKFVDALTHIYWSTYYACYYEVQHRRRIVESRAIERRHSSKEQTTGLWMVCVHKRALLASWGYVDFWWESDAG